MKLKTIAIIFIVNLFLLLLSLVATRSYELGLSDFDDMAFDGCDYHCGCEPSPNAPKEVEFYSECNDEVYIICMSIECLYLNLDQYRTSSCCMNKRCSLKISYPEKNCIDWQGSIQDYKKFTKSKNKHTNTRLSKPQKKQP